MAVEFALLLPIIVLLITGIVEFGLALNAKIELQGAVREGARVVALNSGNARTAVEDASPFLKDPANLTVASSNDTGTGLPCKTGDRVSVEAQYPYEYNILFFGKGTWTLEAKAAMRCGG